MNKYDVIFDIVNTLCCLSSTHDFTSYEYVYETKVNFLLCSCSPIQCASIIAMKESTQCHLINLNDYMTQKCEKFLYYFHLCIQYKSYFRNLG